MNLSIETEREDDGRWIAEIPQLPDVMAYGATQGEAMSKVEALALRVIAEQLDNGERRAAHDDVDVGPVMLKRIAKRTGLKPEDL